MDRLRQLLACATGRRLAAALGVALLLLQVAAAGHLHLPGDDADRRATHLVCDLCVAADRSGIAPPAVALHLPLRTATACEPFATGTVPVAPAPAGYASRAPPDALA